MEHATVAGRAVILHVVNTLEGGGTERVLQRLLCALCGPAAGGYSPAGHGSGEVGHRLVTLRQAGELAQDLPESVACYPLAIAGRRRFAGFRVARIARHWGARVIHARGVGAWADAVLAAMCAPGCRLVLGFHGHTDAEGFRRRDRLSAAVALRVGAVFSTVSQFGAESLRRDLGIPPSRIEVLRNGVDLGRFRFDDSVRRAARVEFGFEEGDFVIGAVGSLTPIKRHDLLLRAFAQVRSESANARLLLVGDGPLRHDLLALASSLGVLESVRFAGSRDDVPAMLFSMDACVSASDCECLSNALLEGLAAGRPVVATAVGENPAVLQHGASGVLVSPGQASALAAGLRSLLGDRDMARRLGRAAADRAAGYEFGRSVEQYREFYGRLTILHNSEPSPRSNPDG